MSTSSSQLLADVAQLHTDSGLMHSVIHADPTVSVMTEGGPIKSVAAAVASIQTFIARGQWVTGAAYAFKDVYTDSGIAYMVMQAHTSTTISADLASGKVAVYQGIPPSEFSSRIGRVVDAISALKGLSHLTYTHAFVTGYYGAGDGGGGAYTYDSTDTVSADNGGTVIVASDGGRWKLSYTSTLAAAQFGAREDGATDDTAAVTAALGARAGGTVTFRNKLYIGSNLTIPSGCCLKGPLENVGERRNESWNYNTIGTILLNGAATINLGEAATVCGCYVLNSALANALPFATATAAQAAVNAFAGTPFTALGADAQLKDVWIGGFAQAFSSSGYERTKLYRVQIDCTSGVYVDSSSDIGRIEDVHCWPFLTTHQTWTTTALLCRAGGGFKITGHYDTGMIVNCFAYGYAIDFDIEAKETVSIINCFVDGPSAGTGQIGFKFTGSADLIRMIGGGASGVDTGLYCNVPSGSSTGAVNITGAAFWGNYQHIVSDAHKHLQLDGCVMRDTNGGARVAVTLNSTVAGSTLITDTSFDSCGTCWNVNGAALNLLAARGNRFINAVDTIGQREAAESAVAAQRAWEAYSPDNSGPSIRAKKARGTASAPAIVASGDQLVSMFGYGYDGSNFVSGGQIRAQVQGAPAVGSMPTTMVFSTNSGSGLTDRLGIHSAGYMYPLTDNAYTFGQSANRWSVIYAATGTINTSDRNTKSDIENASLGLDFINALRPVSYKFKVGGTDVVRQVYRDDDGVECDTDAEGARAAEMITKDRPGTRTHWGLIAQEVKQVVDAAGVDFAGWTIADPEDPDSLQGLRYDQFIAPLIKAVQQLSAEVEALKSKAS
ncbi:tail fiber domain-containing protein [Paraburkholderia sp. USG1]|uniref:tail fiber domain-containing protein n=1 Tax=Paraburkholderia sp. USG1 TaxID=2952268 RepID=UPI0028649B6F|nr:tail fiber domain-containing protein [Paraburkholderia sp. USG1]MDR8395521.1 tail fiber domain-containing protein [Paraburkholderia sp. USG1]